MTASDRPKRRSGRDADASILAALAVGATRAEAARLAGVSERTVYRRLDNSDFRDQLDKRRAELVEATTATLVASTNEAVDTLTALLADHQPATVRLGAARAVLEQAQRWRAAEETERRLTHLEELLEGLKSGEVLWQHAVA